MQVTTWQADKNATKDEQEQEEPQPEEQEQQPKDEDSSASDATEAPTSEQLAEAEKCVPLHMHVAYYKMAYHYEKWELLAHLHKILKPRVLFHLQAANDNTNDDATAVETEHYLQVINLLHDAHALEQEKNNLQAMQAMCTTLEECYKYVKANDALANVMVV